MPERLPLIDLVRGIAVVLVLADHFPGQIILPPSEFWIRVCRNGGYGVTVFFVVSGFLITRMLARGPGGLFAPSYREFYLRRAARIIPLLVVTTAVGVLVMRYLRDFSPLYEAYFETKALHYHAGFWLSIFSFTFNWTRVLIEPLSKSFGLHWDVLWSLAVEEQFYLFYPIVIACSRTRTSLARVLITVLAMGPLSRYLTYLIAPERYILGMMQSFAASDAIASGALLYLVLERLSGTLARRPRLAAGLAGLGAGVAVTSVLLTDIFSAWQRIFSYASLSLGTCLLLTGGLSLPLSKPLRWIPLTWLGRVCYGAYLWHTTILLLLGGVIVSCGSFWLNFVCFWLNFVCFVLFTGIAAAISCHLVERPGARIFLGACAIWSGALSGLRRGRLVQ